jgi:hypothetical protein
VKIAKNFTLLSLYFGIGLALQTVNAENTNVFGDWIILPAKAANLEFSIGKEPLWNPDTNLVTEAIQALPNYLQTAQTNGSNRYTNHLSGIRERLPITGCQFVGVTIDGRKSILLNCFPLTHSFSRGWKERFVGVYDGGPRWWRVAYLPDKKEFTRLRVDLGF